MKYLLLMCALLCVSISFSQSKKKQIEQLKHQNDSISLLNEELEQANTVNEITVKNLSKENATLRGVMKEYIHHIDSLNRDAARLKRELDKLGTKNPDTEESKQKSIRSSKPSTTNQQSQNPFGDGGQSHSASGPGDWIPDDSSGISEGRIRLNSVQVGNIQIDQQATIFYKLTVDSNGNVVAFSHLKSKTTTTNMLLINKLGVAIKKQVKYNKVPNAPLKYVFYTVRVKPN